MKKSLFCILGMLLTFNVSAQFSITGTVTGVTGNPIENALVKLVNNGQWAQTDASGAYTITITSPVIHGVVPRSIMSPRLTRGVLSFELTSSSRVTASAFTMSGRSEGTLLDRRLSAGSHAIPLFASGETETVRLIRVTVDGTAMTLRSVPFLDSRAANPASTLRTSLAKSLAVGMDSLRASAPGFKAKSMLVTDYSGVYDFVLDTLPTGTGSSAIEDGSLDRIISYGSEQYYYGDIGNGSEPLVKIINAVSEEVADVVVVFNPDFVDLTYGEGKVGWNKHSFEQLVVSDHVEITLLNGNGETVLHCKLDLITSSPTAPSGYAALGLGGDGELISGDASAVLSFGTSFDDNLNYYGYSDMLISSPMTDSVFTPNPDYPNWEYYAIYRISVDASIFGESGYGGVYMTSVHASPSKNGDDTINITEGEQPSLTDDPFQYTTPPYQTRDYPPDTTPPDSTDTIPPDSTDTIPADTIVLPD